MHDFEAEILANNFPEIICISETWLKPDFPDSLLPYHDKYNVFRKDRTLRPGGGVIILVRNDLNSHLLEYDCLSDVEALCVQVKCNNIEFLLQIFIVTMLPMFLF